MTLSDSLPLLPKSKNYSTALVLNRDRRIGQGVVRYLYCTSTVCEILGYGH